MTEEPPGNPASATSAAPSGGDVTTYVYDTKDVDPVALVVWAHTRGVFTLYVSETRTILLLLR